METKEEKDLIPIWCKCNLTIYEASVYFNIGEAKLRELTSDPRCNFVLYVGSKKLIKRTKLEKYLENEYSI